MKNLLACFRLNVLYVVMTAVDTLPRCSRLNEVCKEFDFEESNQMRFVKIGMYHITTHKEIQRDTIESTKKTPNILLS